MSTKMKKPTLAELEKKYGKFRPAREFFEEKGIRITFADFIRMARDDLEMTQVEFARKLGMAAGTLCDIEKGRQAVSVKLAVRVAKTAGLSEELAVVYALQDQLDRAKIKMKVDIKIA